MVVSELMRRKREARFCSSMVLRGHGLAREVGRAWLSVTTAAAEHSIALRVVSIEQHRVV